jgi:hypothetical protein
LIQHQVEHMEALDGGGSDEQSAVEWLIHMSLVTVQNLGGAETLNSPGAAPLISSP